MRRVLTAVIATALAVLWAVPSAPAEADGTGAAAGATGSTATLMDYAETTWASFTAMVDTASGLPTDQLHADGHTDVQTSTTNIGAYMWSAVAAERLGIIGHAELVSPARRRRSPRSRAWSATSPTASSTTGTTTATAPSSRPGRRPATPLDPILSSVDNALAGDRPADRARTPCPSCRARAGAIYDSMDFGFYYVPDENRILFHYAPAHRRPAPCCYDTVVSESRIADYIGIAKGELPRKEYYGRWRTFPDTCDFVVAGDAGRPASTARYDGVDVYDGGYPYARHAADARAGAARCSRR